MTPSELQSFRLKRGISLMALAASAGFPESYLEKVEDGKIKISEEELQRITKALLRLAAADSDDEDEEA
ncbi:MAG: helix-turn-helix transcriptional regulator, partial [Candidatus Omnitrophica bacterium]|nr:helix-turn-helix transcriptional regulator [Candidatus Omnitrophota bacterium]